MCGSMFLLQIVVESGVADQLRVTELVLHDVRFINCSVVSCVHTYL